jgi:hypothetical protein
VESEPLSSHLIAVGSVGTGVGKDEGCIVGVGEGGMVGPAVNVGDSVGLCETVG